MNVYVDYLSSELTLEKREKRIKKFETGLTWILVTTDLLARGIDFKNLKMVINYDIPTS